MYFVTLRLVRYSYHSHIGEVIWCWIFWWFYWSFSSLLNHYSCFFGRTWPPFYSSKCFPCILGMLGTDHPYTYYLFPVGWSPYSFGCSSTCRDWHFPVLDDIMKYPKLVTPGCLLLSPTFWKPNGFVLSPIVSFFTELPTQEKLSPTPNKHSFKYHVNMFPLMCKSKNKCLVISSSYHMCILFIFSPFVFNTTYLSWLTTSYGCHLLECRYGHTIDNLNTHLLWCLCGNEHIIAHDTFQDTLVAITCRNGAHVQKEVSHLFLHHTWQQVDILIFINDFQTLMDIIIANPIHTDMVQQTSTTTAHVAIMVVQEKTWSYAEHTLRNDFNPLAIEMYECYHYCFNSLLTNCAQTIIICHQQSSLIPLILISYYWQHVPIML